MGPFAIRDYRRLLSAQVIALFGTGLATVALVVEAARSTLVIGIT